MTIKIPLYVLHFITALACVAAGVTMGLIFASSFGVAAAVSWGVSGGLWASLGLSDYVENH